MRMNYLFIPHSTTLNAALRAGHHSTAFLSARNIPSVILQLLAATGVRAGCSGVSLKGNHKLSMSCLYHVSFLYLTFEFVQIPVISNIKANFY